MSRSARRAPRLPIRVNRRTPPPALQPFTDYFKGFERVGAVRKVFGDKTEAVLARLKIGFISNRQMYMGIRDDDGNVAVGTYHLRNSTTRVLYLDVVHELFHIGQWMRDKEWFTREHERFMADFRLYYVSPLEVPAYEHTVREAERLGMTPKEITEYLKMMPVPHKVWKGFLKEVGVGRGDPAPRSAPIEKLPVKISRNPKLVLHPFTDYFEGFEEAEPVKGLFGDEAAERLAGLRVEFLESPFGSIFPSDEDGHLVVNSGFVKKADLESIYLDVVLCLNVLHRAAESGPAALDRGEFWESPLVLESYRAMVGEARRLGTPDAKVMERLRFAEFMMGEATFRRFVKSLGLRPG